MTETTRLLNAIAAGDPQALSLLFERVYEELLGVAAAHLAQEKPGQTLEPGALVHETYLRLFGKENQVSFEGRAHFFGAASKAMCEILVDVSRRKRSVKHGGSFVRRELDEAAPTVESNVHLKLDLLALAEVLPRFAASYPLHAQLIQLHFYGNQTLTDAARMLGLARGTATRYWRFARAWLYREMNEDGSELSGSQKNI